MEIIGNQIIFDFVIDKTIRRKVFDFEDKLKTLFVVPFILHNIPYGLNEEVFLPIPTFSSRSIDNAGNLDVSQNQLTFTNSFDSKSSKDFQYIKKVTESYLNNFNSALADNKINYLGVITQLFFKLDNVTITELLINSGFNFIKNNPINEFGFTYSFITKEIYFINISVNSAHLVDPNTNEKKSGLGVSVDINSKNTQNLNKEFEISYIEDIKDILFFIIKENSIENYINGEIKLC
jgi:hypothetical protein